MRNFFSVFDKKYMISVYTLNLLNLFMGFIINPDFLVTWIYYDYTGPSVEGIDEFTKKIYKSYLKHLKESEDNK